MMIAAHYMLGIKPYRSLSEGQEDVEIFALVGYAVHEVFYSLKEAEK